MTVGAGSTSHTTVLNAWVVACLVGQQTTRQQKGVAYSVVSEAPSLFLVRPNVIGVRVAHPRRLVRYPSLDYRTQVSLESLSHTPSGSWALKLLGHEASGTAWGSI